MEEIYVDHAATSPVHPLVVEAMVPYFTEVFGNPSSIHRFGRKSRQALDLARRTLARSIGASVDEIIFTSGGTEADNLAIIGYATRHQDKGKHIITSSIEHHAVLHSCKALENSGFEVTYLPVDETGMVSLDDLKNTVREDTILVSIMFGNNEIGTIQPIAEIGEFLRGKETVFHTDAVQAYGIETINVAELGVDFLSVSSHKINGPKGVGFLYAKKGLVMTPHSYGGEQERKRRAGTENVAGVVGFGKASELAFETIDERKIMYQQFQAQMLEIFDNEGVDYSRNGSATSCLPHILNVSFPGVSIEALLVNLDMVGIAASSGSACTAGSIQTSHVLEATCGDSERSLSAIRFSFGYGNTVDQVKKVAIETANIVRRLRTV
ncbi:cysteine desulfurase family protein [Bacillus alkalicellulosilyticus]|uniref:cysteine desulfurase family protein n=1 Tax=Alkalihalobacterium alkalicellulosilyticum TaxID=1912214 RepID=UPI0009971D65|nr:cysteine desulfurase family protein [Bacillus alkalicellulosilyticus]